MIKSELEIKITNGGQLCLLRRGYLSKKEEVNCVSVKAAFRKGKFRLIIGEDLRKSLDLTIIDRRRLILNDKDEILCDVAEFVNVQVGNRTLTVEPFVLPEFLGAILGEFISQDLKGIIYLKRQWQSVSPKHFSVVSK
jgi:hypothetical protein